VLRSTPREALAPDVLREAIAPDTPDAKRLRPTCRGHVSKALARVACFYQ